MELYLVKQLAELLKAVTIALALMTDAVAVSMIAAAVVGSLWRAVEGVLSRRAAGEEARLRLARSLALGLEFLLAADIMRTAVAPTWTAIGQLAAIATLRTALNFFIQREIDSKSEARDEASPAHRA